MYFRTCLKLLGFIGLALASMAVWAQAPTDVLSIINSPDATRDFSDQLAEFGRGIYNQLGTNDLSIHYLGRLFGRVGTVLPEANSHLMSEVFRVFNTGVFTIATGMAGFTTIYSVVNTSRDGKAMGERAMMFWVVIRTFFGAGMLIPKFGGYSAIQLIVMWAVVQGAHVASGMWAGVQHVIESKQTVSGEVSNYDVTGPLDPPTIQRQRTLAVNTILTLFKGELCAAYNRRIELRQHRDNKRWVDRIMPTYPREPEYRSLFTANLSKGTINFGPNLIEEPYPYMPCGEITVAFETDTPSQVKAKLAALEALSRTELRALATQLIPRDEFPSGFNPYSCLESTTTPKAAMGKVEGMSEEERRALMKKSMEDADLGEDAEYDEETIDEYRPKSEETTAAPTTGTSCAIGNILGKKIYRVAEAYRATAISRFAEYEGMGSSSEEGDYGSDVLTDTTLGGWITAGMLYQNLLGDSAVAPVLYESDKLFKFSKSQATAPAADAIRKLWPAFTDGVVATAAATEIPKVPGAGSAAAPTNQVNSYVATLLEGLMQADGTTIGPETQRRIEDVKFYLSEAAYGLTPNLGKEPKMVERDQQDWYYNIYLPTEVQKMENRARSLGQAALCGLGIPFGACKNDARNTGKLLYDPRQWAPMGPMRTESRFLHEDTAVFLGTMVKAWRQLIDRSTLTNPIANVRAYGHSLINGSVRYVMYATQDMYYEWFESQVFWIQYAMTMNIPKIIMKWIGILFEVIGDLARPIPIFGIYIWLGLTIFIGLPVHLASTYFDNLIQTAQMARTMEMAFKFIHVPVVAAAATTTLFMGMMLALYVPMIPFFMFTVAAVSWFLSVIEGMLAAPLIALGMMHPQGHDFLGRAEQAMILLLSVFARPLAILMGFIFGLIMANATMWLFNHMIMLPLFEHMEVEAMTGSPMGRYVMILLLTALYSYVVMAVLDETFSLIYKLPNQLMRWIDPRYHQQSDEIQVLAEAKQGVTESARGASQGAQTGMMSARGFLGR